MKDYLQSKGINDKAEILSQYKNKITSNNIIEQEEDILSLIFTQDLFEIALKVSSDYEKNKVQSLFDYPKI